MYKKNKFLLDCITKYNVIHSLFTNILFFIINFFKDKEFKEKIIEEYIDFFFLDLFKFIWVSIFLIFFILLGLVINTPIGYIFSLLTSIIFFLFLIFSYNSYYDFEKKAKKKLNDFEEKLKDELYKKIETSNSKNIQNYDTVLNFSPKIFSFFVNITKIPFPPLEKNVKKMPIIASRKLEFLILLPNKLIVCKKANQYHLLDTPYASLGECEEYNYEDIRTIISFPNKRQVAIVLGKNSINFYTNESQLNKLKKALKESIYNSYIVSLLNNPNKILELSLDLS